MNRYSKRVVIIGGVAGGATVATRLRRLDENAQIVIFERSAHVSYANCGLPYYVGGVIEQKSDLLLQTPDSLWMTHRIDVRVRHEVTKILPHKKVVEVKSLLDGDVFEYPYDTLVISTGAAAVYPQLPGIGLQQIHTLRNVEDASRLRWLISADGVRSVVVVGGGFIGIEMAENLRRKGIMVTLVEQAQQVLPQLDREMASLVHLHLKGYGIQLRLGKGVSGFLQVGSKIQVMLEGGGSETADLVVLAIGVCPEIQLAKEAGLRVLDNGTIEVDEHMRTSDTHVFAVGDVVSVKHKVTGKTVRIPLAGPASKQARVVADNICGRNSRYDGSLGTSVLRLMDMTVASVGINEQTAKDHDIVYDKTYLSPLSHAGYYPGGKVMYIKVLWSSDTMKLLGAQIVGSDGVDKRIDVLATAMIAGLSVTNLKDIDLAYAPPFSSSKDPVNMVGFVSENIANGLFSQSFWNKVALLPRDGSVTFLDVRRESEYKMGHVEGFINIPLDELRDRLGELDATLPVYVTCQSGLRSYAACRILQANGFRCFSIAGGYGLYSKVVADMYNQHALSVKMSM